MDLYFVLGLFTLAGMSILGFGFGWFGHIAVANNRPESCRLVPWLLAVLGFGCAAVVGRTDPISFDLKAFLVFGGYLTLCMEAGMLYARWKAGMG